LSDSVLKRFVDSDIPVIHIHNIDELTSKYDLPFSPIPTPNIGDGQIFSRHTFNQVNSFIALILSLGSLIIVGMKSHRKIKEAVEYDPEVLL
jgi:hypothetical protein